jgi:predicted TIM-barrel fold metal-dependent hydrolase
VAPDLVRDVNDLLAGACRRHPDRFAAFASLPTSAPDQAPAELKRAVEELGHVGAIIHGRTDDQFLSAERFDPILRTAAELDVPIYLHPAPPTRVTSADNYEAGLSPIVAARFATAGWGWHNDAGIHFLHIVLSGVLDRYPSLQFILGHWGEMVPWFLDRMEETLPRKATGLERTIGEYVRQNTYYTPSGMFTPAHLRFCTDVLGTDRMIYSVDYPFVGNQGARAFLENSGLPEDVRHDIAHRNAERLLRL